MKSSAVMKEKTEGPVMSEPAESRIARIESHVEHLDVVTTDLRVELRRTNDKIDAGFQRLDKKIDDGHKELSEKIDSGHKELHEKIDSGHKELREKIDSGHRALSEKIDGGDKELGNAYKELNKKIDDVHHGLKDKLHSMTVWALLLYATLAGGLLTIIARAFKWI